jgi:hypothetical protein
MPTSIEPSRRFRDGSQAKHVPRGQRGLGRGSIAVSLRAVFILACPQMVSTGKFPRACRIRREELRERKIQRPVELVAQVDRGLKGYGQLGNS